MAVAENAKVGWSIIWPMANPVDIRPASRKRGNPNWGQPIPPTPALATEFELQVSRLRLTREMYTSSIELRTWCVANRNRHYIPEWLLAEWRITVEPDYSDVA